LVGRGLDISKGVIRDLSVEDKDRIPAGDHDEAYNVAKTERIISEIFDVGVSDDTILR